MDTGLTNNVILITGSSSGIGACTARAFAAEGARLVIHGNKNIDAANDLATELGVDALVIQADLTKKSQVKRMYTEALERFGQIDAVVSNAGGWNSKPAPIHELGLRRWEESLALNLTAHFLVAREYFRYLDERRPDHASLVFVGSSAAVFGEANHADYAAAKSGVVYGLTRTLKNEMVKLVPKGRVNTVNPGWTATNIVDRALDDHDTVTRILQTRALRRIARPEDVANAIVYLSSPALAAHITGETWNVNGGMEGRIVHSPHEIDPTDA